MIKPKVVIADKDYSYISSIVAKFITDYYEKIELEVITEQDYFDAYFGTPQNVDVLIVSKEFYSSEIKKHNISSLFVLVDEEDLGETGELDVTMIFKYSSIKEIFNLIIGKSGDIFTKRVSEDKDARIILVTSIVGGVGKTTLAMGVAANLAANYKKVLYIDAEALQTFQFKLQNPEPITDHGVYNHMLSQQTGFYRAIKNYIRKETFDYVPPFRAAISSLGINTSVYANIALEAKRSGDYDYIVVDTDSTFDDNKLTMLDVADGVFVVTTQDKSSIDATDLLVRNINGVNSDKYTFVCNEYQANRENALLAAQSQYSFSISEYISKIDLPNAMSIEAMPQNNEIKKISFLIM